MQQRKVGKKKVFKESPSLKVRARSNRVERRSSKRPGSGPQKPSEHDSGDLRPPEGLPIEGE